MLNTLSNNIERLGLLVLRSWLIQKNANKYEWN
jgi:hypothetical protein